MFYSQFWLLVLFIIHNIYSALFSDIGLSKPYSLNFKTNVISGTVFSTDMEIPNFQRTNAVPFQKYCTTESCWNSMRLSCVYIETQERYLCVSRIAFQEDKNNRAKQILWPKNSSLVYMVYTSDYKLVPQLIYKNTLYTSYKMLKITEFIFDSISMGPEDPSIIKADTGDIYVLFCMLNGKSKRRFYIYNTHKESQILINYYNFNPERNWNPISIKGDKLTMVYRLKPVTFLTCDVQQGECDQMTGSYKAPISFVRPSCNVYELPNGKFISFARIISGVGLKYQYNRVYHPSLILFDKYKRMKFISQPIDLREELSQIFDFNLVINVMSIVRYIEKRDTLLVTVNIQDRIDVFMEIPRALELLNENLREMETLDQDYDRVLREADRISTGLKSYLKKIK